MNSALRFRDEFVFVSAVCDRLRDDIGYVLVGDCFVMIGGIKLEMMLALTCYSTAGVDEETKVTIGL